MNKQWQNTIYKILSGTIQQSYKKGIASIVNSAKKDLTLEFAVGSGPKLSVEYSKYDLEALDNFNLQAFKVAGVGSYQLEEELKKIGAEYQKGTIDRDTFEILVKQKMLQFGIGVTDQPPSSWIYQNLDIATKSSYQGARWNRVNDPELKGLYSHWIYKTQNDTAVRPAHQALEGKVFAVKDVTASKMIPPNDYGCRCYPEYITQEEAGGETVSKGSDNIGEVPSEFRYNPGDGKDTWQRWLDQQFKDMPESELKELQKMINEKFN